MARRMPRTEVSLGVTAVNETSVTVQALVTNGDTYVRNAQVTFSIDGMDVVGEPAVTDNQGKATHELSPFPPSDKAEIIIRAQVMGHGQPYRQVKVSNPNRVRIKSTAAGDQEWPELIVEQTHRDVRKGEYRSRLSVCTPVGKTVATKIQVTYSHDFRWNGELHQRDDTRSFQVDIPAEGLVVDFKLDVPRLELDLFVVGWNTHYEMILLGPRKEPTPAQPGDSILSHLTSRWS